MALGPEPPTLPIAWGSWEIGFRSGEGNYSFIPVRNNFSSPKQRHWAGGKQDIVCGFMKKSSFFFHSCRFGFYLKFGYSETESYFKRAKTCQVPENGEISSMAAFFFWKHSSLPNPPRSVPWPAQDLASSPSILPLLRCCAKEHPWYPNAIFFAPIPPPAVGPGDLQPTAVPGPLHRLEPDPRYLRVGRDDR